MALRFWNSLLGRASGPSLDSPQDRNRWTIGRRRPAEAGAAATGRQSAVAMISAKRFWASSGVMRRRAEELGHQVVHLLGSYPGLISSSVHCIVLPAARISRPFFMQSLAAVEVDVATHRQRTLLEVEGDLCLG